MTDAIISGLVKRVKDEICIEVGLLRGVKEKALKLAGTLETIKNVLEDAERKEVKNVTVRSWLTKLEHTAYQMDDILDEWKYHELDASAAEKVRCSSFIPFLCLYFKKIVVWHRTAKKIENVQASLEEILKEKDQFHFLISDVPTINSATRLQSTSMIDVDEIDGLGIQRNKDDIVERLMNDGDRQQILSVMGMGGIGKTTLARLVYNDGRVNGCFNLRIWICVSHPFDVAGIASEIIENVEKKGPPNTKLLQQLLQKLGDCISGKKFLLVLDDVWNDDYNKWECLKLNLNSGAAGSKILVTTRKEGVAKMMGSSDNEIYHPQLLTSEECWSLLRRISFRGNEERGEFEKVGKKIAHKCVGLPLAVKLLGSVLVDKNSLEDWENVSESEIWDLKEKEVELYPHLLLSYNELSPTLKLCFSYCVVYPKDTKIEVESLIKHWMALGYLGHVIGNPRAERYGRDHFNNLARRSLFQDFEKDDSTNEVSSCKMHDIVHDFAQSLRKTGREEANGVTKRTCRVCTPFIVFHVQAYRTLFWDRSPQLAFCDCVASLRVFYYRRIGSSYWEKLIHLRWLDVSWTRLSKKEMKAICKLYYLQTLSLAFCDLKEIPHELGNLVCLRHLTLSGNRVVKELPDNMFNLIELQTLLLDSCCLEVIPHEIGNLENLRHIDLRKNKGLKVLPVSMYSLVKLHTLLLSECSLKEIPHEIRNFVELRHLDLSYNEELEELPVNIVKLIELHTLSLGSCSLKEIPQDIGSLVKLRHLYISYNEELKELPESMCKLVELQTLHMEDCITCRLPEGLANFNGIRSLDWFSGGSGFNRFGLLKNLNSLTGDLYLSISVSSNSSKELVEDAREAELRKKIHLTRLILNFEFTNERNDEGDFSSSSSSLWVDLIEALEPHQNLQQLLIWDYKGSRLPHWISSPLNLVREIYLYGCSELSSLPPMGKLPFLEVFKMSRMEELKVLGVEW